MTDDSADHDRDAIVARRQRFVAAAIAGLTTTTLATACPCLKVAPPDDPDTTDDGETPEAQGATVETTAAGTADDPGVQSPSHDEAPEPAPN